MFFRQNLSQFENPKSELLRVAYFPSARQGKQRLCTRNYTSGGGRGHSTQQSCHEVQTFTISYTNFEKKKWLPFKHIYTTEKIQYGPVKLSGWTQLCTLFNKTIIPLMLVGYEVVIANSVLHLYVPRWLSTISYPTCPHGIININYLINGIIVKK